MAPEGQCQWNMAKTYQRIIYAYVYRYIKWMYSKIEVTSPKALSVSLGAHHHISNGSFESMLLCARECVSLCVCVCFCLFMFEILWFPFSMKPFFFLVYARIRARKAKRLTDTNINNIQTWSRRRKKTNKFPQCEWKQRHSMCSYYICVCIWFALTRKMPHTLSLAECREKRECKQTMLQKEISSTLFLRLYIKTV